MPWPRCLGTGDEDGGGCWDPEGPEERPDWSHWGVGLCVFFALGFLAGCGRLSPECLGQVVAGRPVLARPHWAWH